MADLSVKFEEPKLRAPTVGGLTGTQLSLLRLWDDENRCDADIFPVSPKGPAERCFEPKEDGFSFCENHVAELADGIYDQYDLHRDREYE